MKFHSWILVVTFSALGFTQVPRSCPAESWSPSEESLSMARADREILQVALADIPPPVQSESEEPAEAIADPLEPMNRAFFAFNDKLYFWVLKPVASGYKAVIPEEMRVNVRNFFSNVTTPVRLVNCLLQGNFKCAGSESARFLINTTLGFVGFVDQAKKDFNIEKQGKDFGQTLGIWGIGPGFYIHWPILGPANVRDSVGYVGDLFLDPQTYLVTSLPISLGIRAYSEVNDTSLKIGEYEDFKEAAIDPYIALKDAYDQYRRKKVRER